VSRSLVTLIASSSAYGFSIGLSNSFVYAVRNLVKFPLLILATSSICALCYFVWARFLGVTLAFVSVQQVVMSIFRDIAKLLAALTLAVAFLALTGEPPRYDRVDDFSLFLGFNVLAIAACGCLAVSRCGREQLAEDVVAPKQRKWLITAWMLTSLLVGGQMCWLIRPFFGMSTTASWDSPWFSGREPGFRGARSFYEAIWLVVVPPDKQD
jgi:hypothetical protein